MHAEAATFVAARQTICYAFPTLAPSPRTWPLATICPGSEPCGLDDQAISQLTAAVGPPCRRRLGERTYVRLAGKADTKRWPQALHAPHRPRLQGAVRAAGNEIAVVEMPT